MPENVNNIFFIIKTAFFLVNIGIGEHNFIDFEKAFDNVNRSPTSGKLWKKKTSQAQHHSS